MSQEDCTIVEQDNQQEKSKAVDVVKDVSTALPSNLKEQIAPSSIGGLDAASAGKAPPSLSSSNNALQQIASRRQQQQQQQRAHPPASSSLETPDINWCKYSKRKVVKRCQSSELIYRLGIQRLLPTSHPRLS